MEKLEKLDFKLKKLFFFLLKVYSFKVLRDRKVCILKDHNGYVLKLWSFPSGHLSWAAPSAREHDLTWLVTVLSVSLNKTLSSATLAVATLCLPPVKQQHQSTRGARKPTSSCPLRLDCMWFPAPPFLHGCFSSWRSCGMWLRHALRI